MEVISYVAPAVVSNTTVYRNRQKSSLIMLELQKQREKGTFCDVLLEAGGLQYWAHSCVLAAHSRKLGSAVENGKAKFGAKGVIKMKLPTSNSLLVESLIKYMYDSHLSITTENVEDMIQLAAKLEMDDIKQCCAVHLCRTMTSNNWAYVKRTGEKYKLEDAIKGIQEYCAKNFCDVVHDFDFLNLDLNLLELILKSGNENCVPRVELHLLYGILKWVSHDVNQRKEHFHQLVSTLNPKLLTTDKCLALFEEETIQNSGLYNDEVTKGLLQHITEALEERTEDRSLKRIAEEGDGDDYEPERKRPLKKKTLMSESDYPRTDDGRFVCPYCCKVFERANALVGHFKVHNAHWLCDICGFTTDVYYQRLGHVQEKHGDIKSAKFVCQNADCDFESADHEEMQKHLEAHNKIAKTGGPFKCDVCGSIFGTKLELHNHRSTNHEDAVFKCQNCTFETHEQTEFETHLKQEHPDVAVILGYMSPSEAKSNKSKAVGDAMKSSDIYSKKSSNVRTVKECPFCKAFCTFKNDRLVSHIKKSHADVTIQQMQEELKKILSKTNDD